MAPASLSPSDAAAVALQGLAYVAGEPTLLQRLLDTSGVTLEELRSRADEPALLESIIRTECEDGKRIVAENEDAIAFLPWFARFPYEIYVAPKSRHPYLFELSDVTRQAVADVLSDALVRLDNLWRQSFPYMLIVHQAPCDGRPTDSYHCHIQVHPPLRGPGLQKFLAGVETGGGHFLNDTNPDEKAAELRAAGAIHYRAR